MIFRIRSPKGIFGQNMSDLRNGSLTGVSRSYQSAILNCDAKKAVRLQMCQSNYICCIHRNDVDSKLMMVKLAAKSVLIYVLTNLVNEDSIGVTSWRHQLAIYKRGRGAVLCMLFVVFFIANEIIVNK